MTDAIRFQCTFWMRPNWHGKAHACGATFGSLNEYVRHYHDAHDIRRGRRATALPRAQQVTAQRPAQVNGQNSGEKTANAA